MTTSDFREFEAGGAPQSALPAGGPGREISLSEARQIYVKRGYHRFEAAFAKFDAAGKPLQTLSVAPFFFSVLWFFYRKMYREGLIFLAVCLGVILVVETFLGGSAIDSAVIGMSVVLAAGAKGMYWRAVDRKIDQAMKLYPSAPDKALAWLDAKGGVNFWTVPVGIVLFALSGYSAYQAAVERGVL